MFITKRKNGYYYIIYKTEEGKKTSISTKSKSMKEATQFLIKFQGRKHSDEQISVNGLSVRELVSEYTSFSELMHSKLTTRDYISTFKFFIKYFGYTTMIKDISVKSVQQYLHHRISTTSLYQARKDLINLKSMFNRAHEMKMIESNPTTGIKMIRVPEKLPQFYREAEFEILMSVIDNNDIKDIVKFAVNTGLRQKEIIELTWRNIDMFTRVLTLDNNVFITKSRKVRSVPLNDAAYTILQNRKFLQAKMYSLLTANQLNKIF